MEATHPRRRRIDRVTAPEYLDGLAEREPPDLRSMRAECQAEEGRLSYTRRMLQGRLDIVRAEATRRADGGEEGLLAALPSILSDARHIPTELGSVRSLRLYEPEGASRRAEDGDDVSLTNIQELDADELAALATRLAGTEARLSALRRQVLDRLDALQAELVLRYKSGSLRPDDALGDALG